ncbi:MAG: bifunctional DNA-binding transcriptional regulator/O6-methylguanine-DNA methyltransferase Ada, partial [Clostridia bacterium]|nr:bifunctional DNA-binding transcriptional regulator/O6-methylguanine-DNA methyltransferase Ada [Deltaproteobacteria bacterium]
MDSKARPGVFAARGCFNIQTMSEAQRWDAVRARKDSPFYFAVRTTGIYCRPSCGARTAKRENVTFYETREDAERAGYRACRRCKPDAAPKSERDAALVAAACRTIAKAQTPPLLAALADEAGVSPHHFHRMFRAVTGLTPRAYANGLRGERVRDVLPRSSTVTHAIYEAGFSGSGRFYATADNHLGMKPNRFRNGGRGESIRFAVAESTLGKVLVAMTDKGICAITLGNDSAELVRDLHRRFPRATLAPCDAKFAKTLASVVALVEQPGSSHALPLDIRGTAFQRRVWQMLATISAGETQSYGQVARAMGLPKSSRAVAAACAANALAIAIPCHRVVRQDGHLSGYRWG